MGTPSFNVKILVEKVRIIVGIYGIFIRTCCVRTFSPKGILFSRALPLQKATHGLTLFCSVVCLCSWTTLPLPNSGQLVQFWVTFIFRKNILLLLFLPFLDFLRLYTQPAVGEARLDTVRSSILVFCLLRCLSFVLLLGTTDLVVYIYVGSSSVYFRLGLDAMANFCQRRPFKHQTQTQTQTLAQAV